MITVELFIVNCIASNLNWKDKTITIRHNIKYITINIKHLESKYDCSNASRIALPFTYSELSNYWFNNIDKYSNLFNIDFNKLIIGIDYSIAPIYNSKNNSDNTSKQNIDTVNENIVIGIFILDTKSIKYLDKKQTKPIGEFTKYEFISQITGNSKMDEFDNIYRQLFIAPDIVYIFKPVSGMGGSGIKIFTTFDEFKTYCMKVIQINGQK